MKSPESWPATAVIGGINSIENKDTVYCISAQESSDYLPVGHIIVGFLSLKVSITDEEIKTLSEQLIKRRSGQAIAVFPRNDGTVDIAIKVIDLKNETIHEFDVQVIEDSSLLNELMIVKVAGSVSLNCNADSVEMFYDDWVAKQGELSFNLIGSNYNLQSG